MEYAPAVERELAVFDPQGCGLGRPECGKVHERKEQRQLGVGLGYRVQECIVREVESRLCAEEADAARSSEPTPFGRETIIGGFEAGKPIALFSNNSANATRVYLARQRLSRYGMPVSGRAFARPDLMKPNPEPILIAAKALSASPEDCVLIGDSLADINGAHDAGVAVIGYANRPEKVERFAAAGANIVITTMADAALALAHLKV
jgi:beta-phosphoglucomutase-like phosphatase (HAD superfamily)